MKKIILTLATFLPISSISMAASIELNNLTKEEKISIIESAMRKVDLDFEIDFENKELENDEELDQAIKTLLKNGMILENGKSKKGSGGESAGIIGR